MTSHYLMLRAQGDCVISFNLLASVPASNDIRIVGTRVAREVAELLSFSRFPIDPVLDDVAAFFDLRRASPLRAVSDLAKVRDRLRATLRPGDRVLFEHADWRDPWILPRTPDVRALKPRRGTSAYEDRRQMIGQAFSVAPPLPASRKPRAPIGTLVLHPGARAPHKRIPGAIVGSIVQQARERGISVTLIDPHGSHAQLASQVQCYAAQSSLRQALALLEQGDLFVGADSLFLHLAFHHGIPACVLIAGHNRYFVPPGMIQQGRCFSFADSAERIGRLLDGVDGHVR